jgi:isopentenyl phosphate kinase
LMPSTSSSNKIDVRRESSGLVLLKFGGSVITFKEKPLSPNMVCINRLSRIIASIDKPVIIVHGGGSFGHYWSVKYEMHTKPARYDLKGVSVVHESMIALNELLVKGLIESGAKPYSVMPSVFMHGLEPITKRIEELEAIAVGGALPVTFGDIVHVAEQNYSILSGDALMTILAETLLPSKVIFLVNVDGLYGDVGTQNIIREINYETYKSATFSKTTLDVTGGMNRKIEEGLKIAASGIDVLLVNGLKPQRVLNAINGCDFEGTLIRHEERRG